MLNEFDGERFTSGRFSIPGRVDSARAYDVLEDHTGDFWVGTPDGLLRFPGINSVAQLARTRPTAVYSIANGLPVARVTPAFEDSRGDVWMSAHLGNDRRVVRWQRSTGRFHQYPETDAPLVPLRGPVFAEDGAGTVWLGSGRGLTRHRDGRFTDIGIGNGDEGRILRVTALHVDPRGRLWVGTQGAGLYRSDDPSVRTSPLHRLHRGRRAEQRDCLVPDRRRGRKLLRRDTTRGVDRLEPESGRFKHFSVADGLAGSEVIAAFRDRDGALWFGTFTGISRLIAQPDVARGPPTVWIGGLRIRGVAQPLELLGQSRRLDAQPRAPSEPGPDRLLRPFSRAWRAPHVSVPTRRNGLGMDRAHARNARSTMPSWHPAPIVFSCAQSMQTGRPARCRHR